MRMQDQADKSQERKHSPWLRLTIFSLALLLLIGAAIIWYINANWSPVLTIIFAVLSVILGIAAWLFPISPNKDETYGHANNTRVFSIPPISINVSPNQHISLQLPSNEISSSHKPTEAAPTVDSAPDSAPDQLDRSNIADGKRPGTNRDSSPDGKDQQHLPEPEAIFLFNTPLNDPSEFYGRARERATLISRTHKRASTSIVGPRRIGKTWLISYLMLVAPRELGSHFQIGYLDATMPSCATIAGFTAKALEELGNIVLDRSNLGLDRLEHVVKDLKSRNHIPVLCIDEFEGLSDHRAFDLNFFSELRAIAQAGLVIIAASKYRLVDIVSESLKSSPFFNIFEQLTLSPFNAKEAQEFVQAKGNQAGFTEQEQTYLLKYGQEEGKQQWFPLHLQLAGKMLLEDKKGGPEQYLPNDLDYWWEFKKRLDEVYRGVVR